MGSKTSSSGNPGAKKVLSSVNSSAPCSPFLMTTMRGPFSRIQRAACERLYSPESYRASLSFTMRTSTRPSSSSSVSRFPSIQ